MGVRQAGKKHCQGPEAGASLNTACSASEEAQADNVDLGVVDLQEAFKTFKEIQQNLLKGNTVK